MTGYDLGQIFSSTANWIWSAPLSQIYPLLAKLSDEGLVAGTPGFSGKRAHTVYAITDEGRAELHRWVSEWHELPPTRDPLLLQALFFDFVPPASAVGVLERLIAEESQRIAQWEQHRSLLEAGATPLLRERLKLRPAEQHERIKRVKAITFDGLIALSQARIAWAHEMIEALGPDTETE